MSTFPPQARKQLKQVGWTKSLELAKVARRDGQDFDCATWLHKAQGLPKEEFRREVEKKLTGKETERSELFYFKLYKSQIPVIEQAIETAALMLGSDKSRGYCSEMICEDFLAGANLDHGKSRDAAVLDDAFLPADATGTATRFLKPNSGEGSVSHHWRKSQATRLDSLAYEELRLVILRRDRWRSQY
jgi:hypothetical protein